MAKDKNYVIGRGAAGGWSWACIDDEGLMGEVTNEPTKRVAKKAAKVACGLSVLVPPIVDAQMIRGYLSNFYCSEFRR